VLSNAAILGPIDDSESAVALLRPTMYLHDEPIRAAFLDSGLKLIALRFLALRPGGTIEEHIADLAREAFAFGAVNIVVARRPFAGETLEIDDEKAACAPVMKAALAPFGITLRDCLIIGDAGYLSMADAGVV
jgi:DNA repair protein RadC